MPIEQRPATEADLPFLLALRRETMGPHLVASGLPLSDATMLERVRRDFDCAWIVVVDGAPTGLMKVRREAPVWILLQLQIGAGARGRGLGGQLVQALIDESTRAGADLRLSVLKANPARQLYERLGFAVIGEDPHEFFMYRRRTPS